MRYFRFVCSNGCCGCEEEFFVECKDDVLYNEGDDILYNGYSWFYDYDELSIYDSEEECCWSYEEITKEQFEGAY